MQLISHTNILCSLFNQNRSKSTFTVENILKSVIVINYWTDSDDIILNLTHTFNITLIWKHIDVMLEKEV